jgi:cytochrome c-type biogenesis protein
MDVASLAIAFVAGLVSFLSPCVLPLVPVYLASVCGPEILEPKADRGKVPIFFHSLSFVIGFSLIFITLGAVAGLAGAVISYAPLVHKIAGGLLVAFGLFLLATLRFPWLNYEKRVTPFMGATTGYLRSLLIGAVFSLGWTPCVGGILGGTLGLALASMTAGQGAVVLAVYSLGLGLPFLIIGLAFDSLSPVLKRIYRYSTWFYVVGGLALILVGVLIITDILVWF